jgi:hypothetical protein
VNSYNVNLILNSCERIEINGRPTFPENKVVKVIPEMLTGNGHLLSVNQYH